MSLMNIFWWFLLAMVLGSFVLPVLKIVIDVLRHKPHDEVVRNGVGCLVLFWELGFVIALVLLVSSVVNLFL